MEGQAQTTFNVILNTNFLSFLQYRPYFPGLTWSLDASTRAVYPVVPQMVGGGDACVRSA